MYVYHVLLIILCWPVFQLVPLLKRNEKSAAALMSQLRKEAQELRKEKKRNTISGIHKFVDVCYFISDVACFCLTAVVM